MKTFMRLVASCVALLVLQPASSFGSITSQTAQTGPTLITTSPQTIPVGFPFQAGGDLQVLDIGPVGGLYSPAKTLTLGSDYTVTGGGYNGSVQMQVGSIFVVSGGAHSVIVNDQITVARNVAINQTTVFNPSGPNTITLLEQALDKTATLSQQLNNKLGAVLTTTAPITGGGPLSGNITIAMPAATTAVDGYLSHTDWNTFNNKSNTVGTVTSVATGTGLTGGTITSTGTLALANTAVTPGSYTYSNLTIDQQGRITSASNGPALPGTGTVTSVSVASANGNSGTVATATTTPAITLTSVGSFTTATNGLSAVSGNSSLALNTSGSYNVVATTSTGATSTHNAFGLTLTNNSGNTAGTFSSGAGNGRLTLNTNAGTQTINLNGSTGNVDATSFTGNFTGNLTGAAGGNLMLTPGAGAGHLYIGLNGPVLADATVSPTVGSGGFGYLFRTTGMENVFGIQNLSSGNETYSALTAFNQNGQMKSTFGYGNLSSIIWKNRTYIESWEGQGGTGADTIVPDIIFVQTAVTGAPGYYGRILMKGNASGNAPGDIDFLKATAWGSDVEPPAARMFTVFADGSGVESVATVKAPSITNNSATPFLVTSNLTTGDVMTVKSTSTTGFSTIDFVSSASNTTQMALGFGNSGTSSPFTSTNYLYFGTNFTFWNGLVSTATIDATTGTWTYGSNVASTSTTTGTQIVTGGVGVSGAGWFGGTLHSNGLSAITPGTSLTLTSSTSGGIIVMPIDGGQLRINHSNSGTSPNVLFQENGSSKGSVGTSAGDMYLVTNTAKSIIFNPGNGTTALTLAPTTLLATFGGNITFTGGNAITAASGNNTLTLAGTGTGVEVFTNPAKLPSYIVSGLPSASTSGAGSMAYVTDSTATAITGLGLAVIGTGSNKVVVVSDGTNWIVQ